MNKRVLILATALCCMTLPAGAQFVDMGTDPGSVRWSTRQGQNFKLYYPEQTDSIAQLYLYSLEKYRPLVGASIGVMPNEMYRRPMTTLLHPFTAESNGSVAWAPRRMDLYALPSPYAPEPFPWIDQLTIHESRHVSQMQFSRRGLFNKLYWFFGQSATAVLLIPYGNPAFLEGDAVTAETALTGSGRGRTADFLEYMQVASDSGDWRDWDQWRYGSQNKFTPDYYKVGYMTVAGIRTLYDDPLFSKRFYDNIFASRWPLPLNILHKTARQVSYSNFRSTFRQVQEHFQTDWEKGYAERGPFMRSRALTQVPHLYESYTSMTFADGQLYALRSGIARNTELVRVDPEGHATHLCYHTGGGSALRWSAATGRLLWSESVPDPRWSLAGTVRIAWWDPASSKSGYLTREGRLFNPAPCPSDSRVAVTSLPTDGSSAVLVLDARDGRELTCIEAPGELQVLETAWVDGDIIASCLGQDGIGLYRAGSWECILPPQPVKIKQLQSGGEGELLFVSDRTGVNELYSLQGGVLRQMTNTRYGAADFARDDKSLYFSSLTTGGRGIYRTPLSSLPAKVVTWSDRHHYAIADKLSAQEEALGSHEDSSATVSEQHHFSKLAHPLSIHSWMPVYLEYDSVSALSGEEFEGLLHLGSSLYFQNRLGSLYGSAGIALTADTEENGSIRPSGHLQLTYDGLYPVLEADLSVGERDALTYHLLDVSGVDGRSHIITATKSSTPLVSADIKAYVPLNLSRGPWGRGIIPMATLHLSNDRFDTGIWDMSYIPGLSEGGLVNTALSYNDFHPGTGVNYLSTKFGLRGYSILNIPSSCIFPRWGIGAEAGYLSRWGLEKVYNRNVYLSAYGYVPGLMRTHGIRLSAVAQQQIGGKNVFMHINGISIAPRGLGEDDICTQWMVSRYKTQGKLAIEYAMPILPIGRSLGIMYLRNFELHPFADLVLAGGNGKHGNLYSAGIEFKARLGHFFWLPFDTTGGLTFALNGGSIFDDITDAGYKPKRFYVGPSFNMTF